MEKEYFADGMGHVNGANIERLACRREVMCMHNDVIHRGSPGSGAIARHARGVHTWCRRSPMVSRTGLDADVMSLHGHLGLDPPLESGENVCEIRSGRGNAVIPEANDGAFWMGILA